MDEAASQKKSQKILSVVSFMSKHRLKGDIDIALDLIEFINTFVYIETGVQTEVLKSSTIIEYLKDLKHSIVKHLD